MSSTIGGPRSTLRPVANPTTGSTAGSPGTGPAGAAANTPAATGNAGSGATTPSPATTADGGTPVPSPQTIQDSRATARGAQDLTRNAWVSRLGSTAAGLAVSGAGGAATAAASSTAASTAATTSTASAASLQLGPGAVDVSTIPAADLKALQQSRNPDERLKGDTIARCQKAYASQIAAGGRVVVTTSAGNGGKPVAVLIPPGFDANKPARVHTHYHGFNSTVGDPKGHSAGFAARAADIQQRDPQTVFVLPEAANGQAGAYATDWSNVKSQAQTTTDALSSAGITQVGAQVVSAHSGGGSALAHAMKNNPDGSGLKADRLELQDCFYGSESAVAKWGATANGQAAKSVIYYHGTNDHSDAAVARAFGSRYQRVDVAHPRTVPTVVDDNGKTVPRYARDAHNRTVGEYMDTAPGP